MLSKIALLVLVVFVAIQFVRPERNSASPVIAFDMSESESKALHKLEELGRFVNNGSMRVGHTPGCILKLK